MPDVIILILACFGISCTDKIFFYKKIFFDFLSNVHLNGFLWKWYEETSSDKRGFLIFFVNPEHCFDISSKIK